MKISSQLNMKRLKLLVLLFSLLLWTNSSVLASDESDVRQMVNKVFAQLKAHDYGSLYEVLPGSSRSRMSKDRFVSALERAQGIYELDRLEVGAVKILGDLAVVDTVLYGRVTLPVQAEGKIVAQQYLMRENGQWRIATGDQLTVKKFLAANPSFSRGFKIRQPRIYVKRDARWVEFVPPGRRQK
jgi:hypothetical protein